MTRRDPSARRLAHAPHEGPARARTSPPEGA